MTDKELLELAAKAAGIQIVGEVDKMICQPDHKTGGFVIRNDRGGDSCWNPLTDDGDALRLAVKLDMNVFQAAGSAYALPSDDDGTYEEQVGYADADGKLAATRRAITRAAAEIGKAMKS